MKFLFLSPAFGAFRAYEPLAFRVAKQVTNQKGISKYDRVKLEREGHLLEVIGYGSTIEVYLDNDETPFVFDVEAV
jgi:hypothetical protein